MMKQLELDFGFNMEINFNLNEPSPNGRVYEKDVVLREIKRKIRDRTLFLTYYDENEMTSISKIIGKATSYFEEDGNVKIDIQAVDNNEAILLALKKITLSGYGTIVNNKVVGYKLEKLFPVREDDIMISE